MNEQHITLDISKTSSAPHVIRLGQGDRSGTTIVAEIYDNGAAFSLSGKSARFLMRLPSGNYYVRDTDCTVSGNTVRYVVDEEHCCAVAGYTEVAYFEILVGTSVIASTQRFCIEVLRSALDGATTGEVYDTEIDAAIRRAIEAAEAAEEAAGGTIPLMNSTTRGGAKLGGGLAISSEVLSVAPLTTAQIDTVASDGSLTSANVLDGTRLTYLWGKLKGKFASLVGGVVAVGQGGTGQSGVTIDNVTGNIANAGSGCEVTNAQFCQWGKVAQLFLSVKCNTEKSSGNVIAWLYGGKLPCTTAPLMNLSNTSLNCAAYPNGEVQAKGSIPAGATVNVIGTYLLK